MFDRYIISLSKFKFEEQLCFVVKMNIIHISRLQRGLNAIVRQIKDNGLNRLIKNE